MLLGGSVHYGGPMDLAPPLSDQVLQPAQHSLMCQLPFLSITSLVPNLAWWIFRPLGFLQTLPQMQTALVFHCPLARVIASKSIQLGGGGGLT